MCMGPQFNNKYNHHQWHCILLKGSNTSYMASVLNQWQVHNQHLHPPNHMEEDCTQLKCMVYQVLQEAQADPNMHELIASVNPNELLN